MEQRFKSLSLFEFQERFSTTEACLSYLADLKWGDGYRCRKCGHENSCNGIPVGSRQCTSCNYTESPTAGTLFHKVKFDLVKAFYIVYFVSTNKKGMDLLCTWAMVFACGNTNVRSPIFRSKKSLNHFYDINHVLEVGGDLSLVLVL